ncbi:hypothetical protein H4Q26_010617 [Puccinia striiformis f. sp. tritici PST-130]|nr:hypothetical protein H4Q26_010617 [Puccinia striiformis f. sp. tritici PST-130]
MGYHPNEAHLLKAKDRMSLKQIFGFRPKRSVGAKNSDKIIHLIDPNPDQLSPLDEQLNSHYLSSGSPQAHPQSRHTSPGSNLSPHSSIHQNQNLPNSINFSTHSESARKQWITAFLSVFRIMSDIDSSSANSLHATISPQPNNCHSQNTASDLSFQTFLQLTITDHQQQQQQSHTTNLLLTENYALPITTSNPLSTSTSSQTQMAVAVPAWIKAVRNADGKKQDSDTDSLLLRLETQLERVLTSREGSIDQSHPSYQQYQQTTSTLIISCLLVLCAWSHQFNRDSDGQHSANQVLSQATDSEQGDHSQPQSTDQSFPQLPPQRTQFVNTTGNRKNGRRPQMAKLRMHSRIGYLRLISSCP